ncbi:MAG: CBS domain-containing protein [Pseudonocardiaceae bacterium]
MTRSVLTTTPQTPVEDAAVVLAGHGVTALPVVDADGRLVGVLTEADVVRGRISPGPRRREWPGRAGGATVPIAGGPIAGGPATVGEVMSNAALTAHPRADAADLARMMIDQGLRSVPVVEQGRVVGIVARRDLVRTIARDDALIAADVRRRLEAYGGLDRWTVHARQGSVTITDEYADPADHHVALVLAQAVPGVLHVEVMHTTSRTRRD